MTEQELQEAIQGELARYGAGLLMHKLDGTVSECEAETHKIIRLFKQAGYVRLAEDQSTPENPYDYRSKAKPTHNEELENGCFIGFSRATDDMLKANFRKVEL